MKRILLLFFIVIATRMFSEDFDISKIKFEGINLNNSKFKIETNEIIQKYNVVYSSILPDGAIYSIFDDTTGTEALVQVGYSRLDVKPNVILMPDRLYNFFSSKYEKKVEKISLSIKFLGWNKPNEESAFLNIESLIVDPNKSIDEIKKNKNDKYYIQLGSYHYYQNSFPRIVELLPTLEVKPKFYMIKRLLSRDGENVEVYRVLAGPYTLEDARSISERVNSKYKNSVFLQSQEKLMSENLDEVIYENKK